VEEMNSLWSFLHIFLVVLVVVLEVNNLCNDI
jgi:hypothetical protein